MKPASSFRVLFLDRKNQLIADELMGQGTVDHAPVYPREIARRALELSASALILVHNHPSGDPTPSRTDIDITREIVDALAPFEIRVHDHLIAAKRGVTSFKSEGLDLILHSWSRSTEGMDSAPRSRHSVKKDRSEEMTMMRVFGLSFVAAAMRSVTIGAVACAQSAGKANARSWLPRPSWYPSKYGSEDRLGAVNNLTRTKKLQRQPS